jgi:hypothetical protein
MKMQIQTIPHKEQRYDTVGDFWEEGDVTNFRISEMSDPRYEYLVLIHELVEYFLCKLGGVSLKSIDEFDVAFEKARAPGNFDEPGDDQRAPYFMQHQLATVVERVFAVMLGVLWRDYEQEVQSL